MILYHLLGIVSFQLKDYKKSSELISEAIKINPKDAEAYNNMGIVSKKLNQFDIAYNNFCNAIKLKPDYAFYITNQIMKPVTQIFSLLLNDMKEFKVL